MFAAERRRLPFTTSRTPRRWPISRTSGFVPLNWNDELRDTTRNPPMRVSPSINSSANPSQRYSFSGSGLLLVNGKTTMLRSEYCGDAGGCRDAADGLADSWLNCSSNSPMV